jgi:hypothetical protein
MKDMGTLTTSHVKDLLTERIAYKPGWKFAATGDGYNRVEVTITWDQLETNPSNLNSDGQYGGDLSPNSEYLTINCDDCESEVDVLRQVLEHCIYLEQRMLQHEAREFLRVKPAMRWDAPFHPHHYMGDDDLPDGMNGKTNWRNTSHRQMEQNASLPDL